MPTKNNLLLIQTGISIKKNMGWCDDINSRYYNKLFKIRKNISHEKLHIKNNNYDLLIPIKYNSLKIVKNKISNGKYVLIESASFFICIILCILRKDVLHTLFFRTGVR